jgi:hypothetical protein
MGERCGRSSTVGAGSDLADVVVEAVGTRAADAGGAVASAGALSVGPDVTDASGVGAGVGAGGGASGG